MRSIEKGEIAQLRAELRAVEKGFVVSRPMTVARYDLLVDDNTKIWRVQVKYADGKAPYTENSVLASLNYTDRAKKENYYSSDQIDAFVIYVPKVDEVLWIPAGIGCGRGKLQIRISGIPRSNSLWYEDYIW